MEYRIGQGTDLHRFVTGRPLILGGIEVPHSHGLEGHSDADALLHSITDAFLGAVGKGDIGKLFPDTSPEFKDADSRELFSSAWRLVSDEGWSLVNLDSTIITEKPKLSPHIAQMRTSIGGLFGCEPERVSVKATTAERLGALGAGDGLLAESVVLLCRG